MGVGIICKIHICIDCLIYNYVMFRTATNEGSSQVNYTHTYLLYNVCTYANCIGRFITPCSFTAHTLTATR